MSKFKTGIYLTGITLFSIGLSLGLTDYSSINRKEILPGIETPASSKDKNSFENRAVQSPTLAPCDDIDWIAWNSITKNSATGTISNQQNNIAVTMNYDFEFASTPQIEHYSAFKRFKAPVPNTAVPRTSWSKEAKGITTICFSQTVKEPVLLLAALGTLKSLTTLNFSEPYVILYHSGGLLVNNATSITGRNGYGIIKFLGDVNCIKITSSGYEDFTDLTVGISVCPDGTPKPATELLAIKPESVQKPIAEITKAVPVIAAVKPEPIPKPIPEIPKPVPVIAAVKPEPVAQAIVEIPKPTPVIAAVKPEPIPKPIPEIPKPVPVIVAVKPEPVKPAPVPETIVKESPKPVPVIVEIPKTAPVVAAVKPEPIAEPIAEIPKPTPVIVAVKPEPVAKPIVEIPKPTPVIAAVKPKPVKPVSVPETIVKESPKPVPVIVEIPKPAPVVAAVKPEAIPEPIAEIPKPVIVAVKLEPVPEPIVKEIPKPVPLTVAIKPEPVKPVSVPEPIAKEIPKPVPVIAAVKPEIIPEPIAKEIPKPVSVIAAVKPEPIKPILTTVIAKEKPKPILTPLKKPAAPVVATMSNKKPLKIEIWDYSGMDYDSISIKLNGKQVGAKIIQLQLRKTYGSTESTYALELDPGDNTLEIYAISEGLQPFTTVGLQIIYDDKPKKILISLKAKETRLIHL